MKRILSPALIYLACAAAVDRADAQPALSHVQPMAVKVGETTEITLQGDKLEEPLSVWTSFSGHVEVVRELDEAGQPKPNPDPKSLRLRVTIPPETPLGVGGIVVGTKAGAAEPLWLMLDDLPSLAEAGDNHSIATAQDVLALTAVDAVSQGGVFDYFRFPASAGQRIAMEVVGSRLGANFDPVMRLLDAEGNELDFADDDPSLGADCRLSRTFAQDGQYVLEVRDVQYRAGGRYRLRVGDFPLVSTAFPLGGTRGESTEFHFAGPDGEAAASVVAAIPADALDRIDMAAKYPGGESSGMATAAVSPLPNVLEEEPNDEPDAAEIALPAAINGKFQQPGDVDQFRFTAKKGEKYTVRGLSRTLGSPGYLLLRLFDEKGSQVAEVGAGNDVESFGFSAEGVHRLSVEELLKSSGPGYAYRIEIEPDQPRFTLALKNDKNLPHKFLTDAEGGFVLDVQANRQECKGPIRLAVETWSGDASTFEVRNETIPAGANETRLFVFTPADAKEGDLLTLRVKGAADDASGNAELSTAALLKTKRPELLSMPPWMDGAIHVAVGPPIDPFFVVSVAEETIHFDRVKGEAAFTLALERKSNDYKQDPSVFVEGLPSGVTASVKKEGKDKEERFEIMLAGTDAPAGEHPFQILAVGDRAGRGMRIVKTATLKVE